jgi:heptosyltransferase I
MGSIIQPEEERREVGPAARICIVLLTGLGDVVHGLPVVNALKAAEPACRITWIVEPMPAAILRHHPAVDEIVVFERRRGWRGVLNLARDLRGRAFDQTLNFNIYAKSAFPTLFSGAPRRIGFGRDRARDGVWLVANEHLEPRRPRHTQEMFLEFLDHLGVRDYAVEWRLGFTEEERRAQREFFGALDGRPVAALVVASARAGKDWPAARYAEVADALEHDFGHQPILLGGPSERERRIVEEITARARTRPVWALGEGVRRVAWTIAGSRFVIAPDTGPLHIARALGVPVIGLYGSTNPYRVGPWRRYQELWVDRWTEPGAAPDPSSNEPKPGRMEQIMVADVLERVERVVRCYGPREDGRQLEVSAIPPGRRPSPPSPP